MNKGILIVLLLINLVTVTQSVAECSVCYTPFANETENGGLGSCSVFTRTLDEYLGCLHRECGTDVIRIRELRLLIARNFKSRYGLHCIDTCDDCMAFVYEAQNGGPRICSRKLDEYVECVNRECDHYNKDIDIRELIAQSIKMDYGFDCNNLAANIPTTPLCYFCTVLLTALYFGWRR